MSEKKLAAIYCRLSKDDEQCGDSVSIETQKMMLTKYCLEQNFEIFDIYVDDGYSGLNFNRPSFNRLLQDLEAGKFDILITKDLSRLGRDYIQTGYYIDIYFATKHIRYIAVNDGIDTLYDNNDIAPFKNILNDMYAKDLSRKIKSAKHQRALNGLFISAQAPYGYRVDPDNKNHLIIDREVAQTVKHIFELAYEGYNYSEISRMLEKLQVLPPSVHKVMTGDTRFVKHVAKQEQLYKWPYQTVKAILTNPIYVGDMVNHKVEVVNYKTKEHVRIPLEDQIIVRDQHEPIIDREIFESVNQRLSNRCKRKHQYENIFKGVVFCAECGEELQLIAKQLKYETKPLLRCHRHLLDPNCCTHHHFIYYDDLLDEVQKQFQFHIAELIQSSKYDELCKMILNTIYNKASEIRNTRLQQDLSSLNKSIKAYYRSKNLEGSQADLETLYRMRNQFVYELSVGEHACITPQLEDLDNVKNDIKHILLACSINRMNIKFLISRIEVGHLERDAGETRQKIKIYYTF